jgi:hypothetical protein
VKFPGRKEIEMAADSTEGFTLKVLDRLFVVFMDRHGDLTTCSIVSNLKGMIAKTGTALRNPADAPDQSIGDRTAFKRAAGNLDFSLFMDDPKHAPELYKLLWRAYRIYRKEGNRQYDRPVDPRSYSALPVAADAGVTLPTSINEDEPTFKVGDRVTCDLWEEHPGPATITKIDPPEDQVPYGIRFDDGFYGWVKARRLTLITEPVEVEA